MPLHTAAASTQAAFFDGLIASGQLVNWDIAATASYHAITPPAAKGWPAIAFERLNNDDWEIKDTVGGTTERLLDNLTWDGERIAPMWFVDEPDYFAFIHEYTFNAPSGFWSFESVPYTGFAGTVPDDVIHVCGWAGDAASSFADYDNGFARRGDAAEIWPEGSLLIYGIDRGDHRGGAQSPAGNRLLLPLHLRSAGKYRGTASSGIRQVMKGFTSGLNGQTFVDDAAGTWVEFGNSHLSTNNGGPRHEFVIAFQYTGGIGYSI